MQNMMVKYKMFSPFQQGAFLAKIKSDNPGIPCFLFGHSTGGAVVLKVRHPRIYMIFCLSFKQLSKCIYFLNMQAASYPHIKGMLEGIVLTSPALRVKPAHPIVGVNCSPPLRQF